MEGIGKKEMYEFVLGIQFFSTLQGAQDGKEM
jgi:hypothetical protein